MHVEYVNPTGKREEKWLQMSNDEETKIKRLNCAFSTYMVLPGLAWKDSSQSFKSPKRQTRRDLCSTRRPSKRKAMEIIRIVLSASIQPHARIYPSLLTVWIVLLIERIGRFVGLLWVAGVLGREGRVSKGELWHKYLWWTTLTARSPCRKYLYKAIRQSSTLWLH